MKNYVPFNSIQNLFQFSERKTHAVNIRTLSGGGHYDNRCASWISKKMGNYRTLITPSCSAALELCILLLKLKPGDEVIMPSFTFSSTANAVALRGATPVFVDIDQDTLNIDPARVREAITQNTKCILVVHYGGNSCDMDAIIKIAEKSNCYVIEDAAQAIGSKYKDKYLGTIGDLGTFSFHETKNIVCGEGGSILFRDNQFYDKAEIIREKGTDRSQFLRGEKDKYTWREIGSSYLLGEMSCRFLYHQLLQIEEINDWRVKSWFYYQELTEELEWKGYLKRQIVPEYSSINGHMFFVLINDDIDRNLLLELLKEKGVFATSHYIPLHNSPAGKCHGRCSGELTLTNKLSKQLIRLPLYYGIKKEQQNYVVATLNKILQTL
jgi:dTDP-4-amino-4,6-dideoxygalactose transaminase